MLFHLPVFRHGYGQWVSSSLPTDRILSLTMDTTLLHGRKWVETRCIIQGIISMLIYRMSIFLVFPRMMANLSLVFEAVFAGSCLRVCTCTYTVREVRNTGSSVPSIESNMRDDDCIFPAWSVLLSEVCQTKAEELMHCTCKLTSCYCTTPSQPRINCKLSKVRVRVRTRCWCDGRIEKNNSQHSLSG